MAASAVDTFAAQIERDYYGTAPETVKAMCVPLKEMVTRWPDDDDWRVLEPSAGKGNLLNGVLEHFPSKFVFASDIHKPFVESLKPMLPDGHVKEADFLADDYLEQCGGDKFDVIVMNPPWSGGAYFEHIAKATTLLRFAPSSPRWIVVVCPKIHKGVYEGGKGELITEDFPWPKKIVKRYPLVADIVLQWKLVDFVDAFEVLDSHGKTTSKKLPACVYCILVC